MEIKPFDWNSEINRFVMWVKKQTKKEDINSYEKTYDGLQDQGKTYCYSELTSELLIATSEPEIQERFSKLLARNGIESTESDRSSERQKVFNEFRKILNEAIVNTLIEELSSRGSKGLNFKEAKDG